MTTFKLSSLLVPAFAAALLAPPALGQNSTSNFNPSWSTITDGISRSTNTAEASALVRDVRSGAINTRGTRVSVNNSDFEVTSTGQRSVIADSEIRWHNPFGNNFRDPGFSRWYQKDGNTQVFRIFPGDENFVGDRVGAGRIEAFVDNPLTTLGNDGQTVTFSARFHVAQHNSSREVLIYQSKGRDVNDNYRRDGGQRVPAWAVALFVERDGDIVLIERRDSRLGLNNVRRDTGFNVGQSFNLRVVDDGFRYRASINGKLTASGTWERGTTPTVQRWGAYVQGGTNGILTGRNSNPFVLYVSGARVTKR